MAVASLDIDAREALAATLGDLGANRQMLAVTRDILRLDAQNPWALYCQAVMAARAGQYLLAQSLVQRIDQNLADMPGLLLLRGAIDLQLGAPDRARLSLGRLVARQPANVQARQMLARASLAADDPAAVLEVLGPLVSRADADSYSLMLAARAAEASGDRTAAVLYLKQIKASAPGAGAPIPLSLLSTADPEDQSARALLQSFAAGQTAPLRAQAVAARTANPGNPAVQLRLGDVEALLGNWPAALRAYRAAADLDFSEKVMLRLSRALIQTGNGAEAQRLWLLFARENPQNISAQLMVADALIAARQWQAAQHLLEGLRTRLGNHHPHILSALSLVWQRLGNPGAAAAYARAARIARER
ncbi:MAG: hypothetical protein ACKOXK_04395 [Chakrabartia sp.]